MILFILFLPVETLLLLVGSDGEDPILIMWKVPPSVLVDHCCVIYVHSNLLFFLVKVYTTEMLIRLFYWSYQFTNYVKIFIYLLCSDHCQLHWVCIKRSWCKDLERKVFKKIFKTRNNCSKVLFANAQCIVICEVHPLFTKPKLSPTDILFNILHFIRFVVTWHCTILKTLFSFYKKGLSLFKHQNKQ